MSGTTRFASFAQFYPHYLAEHANPMCRRLHVVGSLLVIGSLVAAAATRDARWLIAAPLCGYGFAWLGHLLFEHNRPATFTHPLYSFLGDWVMLRDVLTRRLRW